MAEQVKDREGLRELMAKALAQSTWEATVRAAAKLAEARAPESFGEIDWEPFLPAVDAQLAALAEAGVAMVPESLTDPMLDAIPDDISLGQYRALWNAMLAAGRIDR